MKKNALQFLITAFALAVLSLPSLAQGAAPAAEEGQRQGRHHGMPSVDERLQHMTKVLNLTDDQQTKLRPILQEQHDQVASLKQDTSMSQHDRRAKFQQIRQDTHEKIRGVLNDQQKAKFDEMLSQQKDRMGKHGQKATGPHGQAIASERTFRHT